MQSTEEIIQRLEEYQAAFLLYDSLCSKEEPLPMLTVLQQNLKSHSTELIHSNDSKNVLFSIGQSFKEGAPSLSQTTLSEKIKLQNQYEQAIKKLQEQEAALLAVQTNNQVIPCHSSSLSQIQTIVEGAIKACVTGDLWAVAAILEASECVQELFWSLHPLEIATLSGQQEIVQFLEKPWFCHKK